MYSIGIILPKSELKSLILFKYYITSFKFEKKVKLYFDISQDKANLLTSLNTGFLFFSGKIYSSRILNLFKK